ncbi:MAG: 16S rRNA (cytosine(1402)-N(4))-methyltransferase RsmH [Aquificae bacterium]|nr:16S rRNA (cytosine(1402)-N(4))-methyltransferase RsmH [Aquificota bacterium]
MTSEVEHYPVLHREIVDTFKDIDGNIIVDATVGGAGHSYLLLKNFPEKKIIGIDKDEYALKRAKERLKDFEGRYTLVKSSYKDIDEILDKLGFDKAHGFLFDLGVSMFQLKNQRGFSFQRDDFLDMRMDKDQKLTAYDVVNTYPEHMLENIIKKYGEERFSKRIAKSIVEHRKKRPIQTTKDLENIIFHAYPRKARYGRIHPATRTFQAIRIEVNNELEELELALKKAIERLDKGGRIAVISFHSLEDRIAKNLFKEYGKLKKIKNLTKKPIVPKEDEIKENPPSRSAKLRIAERI